MRHSARGERREFPAFKSVTTTIDRVLRTPVPIHRAAQQGWTDVIAALLDAGADVNAKGHNDAAEGAWGEGVRSPLGLWFSWGRGLKRK